MLGVERRVEGSVSFRLIFDGGTGNNFHGWFVSDHVFGGLVGEASVTKRSHGSSNRCSHTSFLGLETPKGELMVYKLVAIAFPRIQILLHKDQ